jgi:hypothetical protein
MHAEYAVGSPGRELLEEAFVALAFVPIRATFAPEPPPPHAAATKVSPIVPASASPRTVLLVVVAIASPSQLTDLRV